jgi:hypothetical protein
MQRSVDAHKMKEQHKRAKEKKFDHQTFSRSRWEAQNEEAAWLEKNDHQVSAAGTATLGSQNKEAA